MTAPDLTTEVVGYRQWYVTPDLELRSAGLAKAVNWQRGDQTAACHRVKQSGLRGYYEEPAFLPDPCGEPPGQDCECGFYALHDPSDHWYGKPREDAWAFMAPPQPDPLVSGIIVAWGALQVHYQGFRAQHARIAALALPKTKRDQAIARAVARAYGVPCVPAIDLPKIAAEYGGTVPAEYRPDKPKPRPNELAQLAKLAQGYAFGGSYSSFWATTAAGTTAPAFTWTTYPPLVLPPSPPQPKVSPEARRRMDLIQGLKQPSNRQGPPKPKRAPKRLG